nr:MAG TPA: Protein of unknown function (DUF2659) [Caudoviricetes sp.]
MFTGILHVKLAAWVKKNKNIFFILIVFIILYI